MGKRFGGGTTYKAVWGRMTQIKDYAKLINEALETGVDPITVELSEAPTRAPKQGQGIYARICLVIPSTAHQISFHFASHFELSYMILMSFKSEVSKLHGGGVKYHTIWSIMSQFNGHAAALREAYDSGIDPSTVELNSQTAARGRKKTQGNHGHYRLQQSFLWSKFSTLALVLHFILILLLILASSLPKDGI